ncbi:collectrin isoform X1 [Ambystoma mexicanum]|uniref:collectrin isoform X1 n=1 Tax=Ambystoma mexicanum TaxID=8296 RepID=UPI0037E92B70
MMLRALLLLAFSLARIAQAQLCYPKAPNAQLVRISLKAALGDKAYAWDQTEEYLFQSMVAFAMRSSLHDEAFNVSNVQLCNITPRVSFWFVVTNSSDGSVVPDYKVERAIREKRTRINSAFLLNDNTLEFVQIPATLVAPTESSVTVWLIVFGVILSIVVAGIIFLVVSGIRKGRAKKKALVESDVSEDVVEMGEPIDGGASCESLDFKGGQINGVYVHDRDENTTPL